MAKQKWFFLIAATAILALIITVCVIWGVSSARRRQAEETVRKIASLQEPDFEPAYLEANQKKADYHALHSLLAQNGSVTWLFAGDSITHGCSHTGYYRNFAEYFEDYIKAAGIGSAARRDDIVINTAVSSATTQDMETYFDAWITNPDADVAFLSFGTNDCATDGMTPERFGQNLLHAIQSLRGQGAIPILQTPNVSNRQHELQPYLETTRRIAAEESVLLVDINQYWAENQETTELMMNDALHPNAAGHLTWCRFLLKSLGMYREDSALAQLSYREVASNYTDSAVSAVTIKSNKPAKKALSPALINDSPVTWVFTGGNLIQGLSAPQETAGTGAQYRNGVQHFTEVARWETAENFVQRCKTIINAGRTDYTVQNILEHYGELAGRFQPDVFVYLPDVTDHSGAPLSISMEPFTQSLTQLIRKAQADNAQVLLITPPELAGGTQAGEVTAAMKETAASTGAQLIDWNAVYTKLTQNAPEENVFSTATSAQTQFLLGRTLSLSLYNVKRSNMR